MSKAVDRISTLESEILALEFTKNEFQKEFDRKTDGWKQEGKCNLAMGRHETGIMNSIDKMVSKRLLEIEEIENEVFRQLEEEDNEIFGI